MRVLIFALLASGSLSAQSIAPEVSRLSVKVCSRVKGEWLQGSGIIVGDNAVITAAHVIKDKETNQDLVLISPGNDEGSIALLSGYKSNRFSCLELSSDSYWESYS